MQMYKNMFIHIVSADTGKQFASMQFNDIGEYCAMTAMLETYAPAWQKITGQYENKANWERKWRKVTQTITPDALIKRG